MNERVETLKARLISKAMSDPSFRAQLVADAKAIISKELGLSIPDEIQIEVHEESTTTLHLVLPQSPEAHDHLSEADLASVAGGYGAVTQTITDTRVTN